MKQPPLQLESLRRVVLALCLAVLQPLTWAALAGTFVSGSALAQEDPPGRIGRLASTQGAVVWWDAEAGQWAEAVRNRPLTAGDRIATPPGSRAEIRIGSVVARLGSSAELEVLRLDDGAISLQLHSGSLALRVRSSDVAAEVDVFTREARMLPLRAGHYRFDRLDDTTSASVWRGELQIDNVPGDPVRAGQRVNLYREVRRGGGSALRVTTTVLPDDPFARWVQADDAQEERTASNRFVSPEMTGAEDLDRYGRWSQHPDFGAIWLPADVRPGWAPYREGRWVWVSPWGWSWVDDAPWGFAPFHYGRWVHWRGGWGWVPGAYVARPVYAPGLVVWMGGSQGGGAGVGWLPLAPHESFQPHYRASPRYLERINIAPPSRRQPAPPRPGAGFYGNQEVPGAITLVPPDGLTHRPPPGARVDLDPRQFTPGAPPMPRRYREPLPPQAEAPAMPPQLQPQPQPQPRFTRPAPPQAPQPPQMPPPQLPPQMQQPMPPAPPMQPIPPAPPMPPAATTPPQQSVPAPVPPSVPNPRGGPRPPMSPPAVAPASPPPPVPAAPAAPPPRAEPPAATAPQAPKVLPPERDKGRERERERDDDRKPRGQPRPDVKENQR
jgi:hypothetical protein